MSQIENTLESLVLQIHTQKEASEQQFPTGGIPYGKLNESEQWRETKFNPDIHLAPRKEPDMKYSFEDLGIPKPASACSDIAGTSPFPLYEAASIPLFRKALLNPRYVEQTSAIFGPKTLIIRNTAAHSPFFRKMCNDPAVLERLSCAAGVALEPVMETMELGHANVQVDFSKYAGMERSEMFRAISKDLTAGHLSEAKMVSTSTAGRSEEEIKEAVTGGSLLPWHFDSYPWVSVAMISDTSSMVGGETVIERGDGSFAGITQPGMGSVMMLQGGLVKHLALSSSSSSDRITIITSFRAKAVGIYDSSFMSNIRCYSDLPELYRQWMDYRLDRLVPGMKKLQDKRRFVKFFDEEDVEEEKEQRIVLKEYAKRTLRQMVPSSIIDALVSRLGCGIFYVVRDGYVDGSLFTGEKTECQLCKTGAVLEKVHLTACPGRQLWRPDSPVWDDYFETAQVVEQEGGLELRKRMEELQVKDFITKWKLEKRPWGILDEMAAQGLIEYMIEYLELCGMKF